MKLDLAGSRVVSVQQDFQVRIEFSSRAVVAIEGSFRMTVPGGEVAEHDQGVEGFAVSGLDALVGATVISAGADGGTLRLTFTDGHELLVQPLVEFEAWDFDAPGRTPSKVVSMPGGGLAVW